MYFVYFFYVPQYSFAYLDPGTGAMIIQGLIGFIAAFIFLHKTTKTSNREN